VIDCRHCGVKGHLKFKCRKKKLNILQTKKRKKAITKINFKRKKKREKSIIVKVDIM
jgi:hypothetical protein